MKLENSPNYLRYSGISVIITLNPLHWRWKPIAERTDSHEYPDCYIWRATVAWLFLTVRVWIDDGQW